MSFSKEIDATLSISYPKIGGCEDGEDGVTIRIEDRSSRTEFVELRISHKEFSRALSALQARPAIECTVRGLDRVGKTMERELFKFYTEVDLPPRWSKGGEEAAEAMLIAAATEQGHATDGWKVSAYLALHSQNGNGKDADGRRWYLLSKTRYV